jgi:tRNA pseudouridine32 synthase/23S rRNA pseudouridine746 synthase
MVSTTERRVVTLEHTVRRDDPLQALRCISRYTDLSHERLKDAMRKGALWLTRRGRKPHRLRRVTAELRPGDHLTLYYDSAVLAAAPPLPVLLQDCRRYSAWYKPAGLLVEGSRYGDHAALERLVELHFGNKRPVYLVHRLDREAAGVMVVAHTPQAAARLSALFRERDVEKVYEVEVRGDLRKHSERGVIDVPLDGKPSRTDFEVIAYDAARGVTKARVRMQTGRYHQIRRHFAHIGYAVMGDPKYGTGNSDPRGMQLVATLLGFTDPWTGERRTLHAEGAGIAASTAISPRPRMRKGQLSS